MKIAIDCADLDYSRIDGTRVYIKELLNWFGKIETEDDFFLFHKKDFNTLLAPKKFPNYHNQKIPYPLWWTQTRFAYELRILKPDICWMPIQQLPMIGPKNSRYVITIHDLAFKYFPDHFPKKDVWKHNFFTNHAVKNADTIIAISKNTKKDILKFYPKVREEKIKVVHHGFKAEQFSKKYSEDTIKKALDKHALWDERKQKPEKYLLYVGAIQPRKNLVTLISAFENLKKEKGIDDLKLVFVGEKAWKEGETFKKIENSPNKKDIVLTGKVDFKNLAIFYQNAEIFVYPSLYEGFGIPILEAMAARTPVVVANNSSLVEVAGNASEKFESKNSDDLANVLRKMLKSSIMRAELTRKGFERVKHFSWEKCAQETLKILKNS